MIALAFGLVLIVSGLVIIAVSLLASYREEHPDLDESPRYWKRLRGPK